MKFEKAQYKFFPGIKLFEDLNLTFTTEIGFTDGCMDWLNPSSFVFCKHFICSLYHDNRRTIIDENDEIVEWANIDQIVIIPWESVDEIITSRGEDKRVIKSGEINEWSNSLPLPVLSLPLLIQKKGLFTLFFQGRPLSYGSAGSKLWLEKAKTGIQAGINEFLEMPLDDECSISVDIFTSKFEKVADIDNITKRIIDSLKGSIILDDKQVLQYSGNIYDTTRAFKKLECRTSPMPNEVFDHLPLTCFYPLMNQIMDYFVVRVEMLW